MHVLGRRAHDGNLLDASDFRGDDGHDGRRGVRCGAPRDVRPDALDGSELPAERDPLVFGRPVLTHLALVEGSDVVNGVLDGVPHVRIDFLGSPLGCGGHLQIIDIHVVELRAVIPERRVAVRPDRLDDVVDVTPDCVDAGVPIDHGRILLTVERCEGSHVHGAEV
jgi:hypothetical protein